MLRARRSLLAKGELRLFGSTLIVSTGPSSVVREISELQQIGCYPSGGLCANVVSGRRGQATGLVAATRLEANVERVANAE